MNRIYHEAWPWALLLFMGFTVLFCGCSATEENGEMGSDINLEYGVKQVSTSTIQQECHLSDNYRIISLQVSDSSLLGQRSHVVYADSLNILVSFNQIIYRFNRDGRFLNNIGKIGNGPCEHTTLYSESVDSSHKELYLYAGNNRMIVWSIDGKPLREFNFEIQGTLTFAKVVGNNIISEVRNYTNNGALTVSVLTFTLDGSLLHANQLHEYAETETNYQSIPITYSYQNSLIYKDTFDGWSYTLNVDSIAKYRFYNLGKFSPTRDTLEDMNKRQSKGSSFMEIVDLQEDDSNVYILAVNGRKLYGFVTKKENNKFIFADKIDMPQKGGGIPIDRNKTFSVWPTYIDAGGRKYSMVDITEIDTTLITPRKINNIPFSADPNPIVVMF